MNCPGYLSLLPLGIPTLGSCGPYDCKFSRLLSPWVFQARMLEWIAISSSRGSSRPRIEPVPPASCIGRWILYHCATREAHEKPTLGSHQTNMMLCAFLPQGLCTYSSSHPACPLLASLLTSPLPSNSKLYLHAVFVHPSVG